MLAPERSTFTLVSTTELKDALTPFLLDEAVCDRARVARDPRFDGRFFIGVLSTGIYCRVICPSPPAKRKNVRFFKTAAAALEAGFRPCLRCRPEVAPGSPAWNGTSATVSRALRLIADGALNESSVEAFADRLGISARHVHRLFLRHLGASPTAVAHTRRLHFAKQLLTETTLPMGQVAAAAGFGSVRRFNDTFRKLYKRTPSAIRKLDGERASREEGRYTFRLGYRPPYDWSSLLSFLAARATPGVEEVRDDAYRRTFVKDGRPGSLEVRKSPGHDALEIRIEFSDPLGLLPIVSRVRTMFDLNADPWAIARELRKDPLLRGAVGKYPGLRVPGAWDGFELCVRAILGQQVSVAGATTLAGRLAQQFGAPLEVAAGGLSRLFPTALALSEAPIGGLPASRAESIRCLARAVASGALAIDDGRNTLAALRSLPGIGEWTAQYVAMRALNDPDAFPAQDLVLLRTAGEGHPLAPRDLLRRAESWRPWRAYAAMYLWRASSSRNISSRDRTGSMPPSRQRARIAP
jgi:AraC family transcriptional regulator of adaptative response / DNA-3-methyladenine glycosylase II